MKQWPQISFTAAIVKMQPMRGCVQLTLSTGHFATIGSSLSAEIYQKWAKKYGLLWDCTTEKALQFAIETKFPFRWVFFYSEKDNTLYTNIVMDDCE